MKTFDCVLFDCSGSMMATADSYRPKRSRMDYALDMLFDMYSEGNLDGRTLIVPFDSVVRGGITMDMLVKMSQDEVSKLFAPSGGTNIKDAFDYCGSSNTLLITDDPEAGRVMGDCCPIIYMDKEIARLKPPSGSMGARAMAKMMKDNPYE